MTLEVLTSTDDIQDLNKHLTFHNAGFPVRGYQVKHRRRLFAIRGDPENPQLPTKGVQRLIAFDCFTVSMNIQSNLRNEFG